MPDVRNCKKCGKIFNYIGGAPICSPCREQDEADFARIKEYLYKYPGTVLSKVSTELDISVERIKRYLKEGRLEIVGDDPNMLLECEVCGRSIKTGRYCSECETELARTFKDASKSMESAAWERKNLHADIGLKYLKRDARR